MMEVSINVNIIEMLFRVILSSIAVEAITSIILCEDSIFHTVVWSKVQGLFKNWPNLRELSRCSYCISFWISIGVCYWALNFTYIWPILVLTVWRLSHLFDAVYRYYLVRSFVVDSADIEDD
jgi:hypothetical protein